MCFHESLGITDGSYEVSFFFSLLNSGIPMYSSSLPWPVFSDRPPISGHSEFTISNSHRHPSKPQIHDTAKFSSGPAFEAFRYNYDATFLQRVNGISSLATTAMESSNREKRSEKEERKLSCGICYKVFMRPSALRVHMRIHNGEKPFQCVHCPRSFSQSGNLTVHMRIHTGEKPFTCTICRKGFSQSNSLKVHIRTHTGEKPFKCRSCRKRFTDRLVKLLFLSIDFKNSLSVHSHEQKPKTLDRAVTTSAL